MTKERHNVTVYGSLRGFHRTPEGHLIPKPMHNHLLLAKDETTKFLGVHELPIGDWDLFSLGSFPYLYPNYHKRKPVTTKGILVETYDVSSQTYKAIERLEGYPNFYNRCYITTPYGNSSIYFIEEGSRSRDTSRPVREGDWTQYMISQG